MIRPDTLRALREQQGLSVAALARESNVSPKQIRRLENPGEASSAPRLTTVERLATALRVEPAELAEEAQSRPRRLRLEDVVVLPGTGLAYELIQRRFGVTFRQIIEMAPLLFALLAEKSLAWRQEQLGALEAAMDAALELAKTDRLRFALRINRAHDDLAIEEKAIARRDLFGDPLEGEDANDLGPYRETEETVNPFADYLRHFAGDIEPVTVADDEYVPSIPSYSVYEDDLRCLTGGSWLARFALEHGHVRLADIPDELMAEGAAEERTAWLESKVPEDLRKLLELEHPAEEETPR